MPELEQKSFQKRNVAYKVRISDILNANFVKDGFSAGYIKLGENNVSRVNVIATMVFKSESPSLDNAVIDDGTGRISLRTYEQSNLFAKIDVGDFVLVIGRLREFNNEKYIVPEIMKKMMNVMWADVRRSETGNMEMGYKSAQYAVSAEDSPNVYEKVCSVIKKLDNGDGVFIEDIIKSLDYMDVEKIINRLLENGDVFELKPGKLKVLE
ncbi:hypothetical protein HYX02_07845 [Candidatus Woesearchaeota archaeon]|nr:hypothetical protein [Candidatus Woesearchaeota archaeon]